MPSPPNANSLLNLLNPYASVAASRPSDDSERTSSSSSSPVRPPPESPSAVLLRELQFESGPKAEPAKAGKAATSASAASTATSAPMSRRASRRSPPTSPTPRARGPFFPDSSDDEPPQSLLFDGGGATPTSRSPGPGARGGRLAPPTRFKKDAASRSPGPFRRRPSSTSSSTQSPPASPRALAAVPHVPDVPSEVSGMPSTSPSTSAKSESRASTGGEAEEQQPQGREEEEVPAQGQRREMPGRSRMRRLGRRKYLSVPSSARDADEGPDLRRAGLSGYNKALWKWVNVTDLDAFLQKVYIYYEGKGIWCIVLKRVLKLLTRLFVIGFSTFLTSCIDYKKLAHSVSGPNDVGRLDDALIPQCLTRGSFWHMLLIVLVVAVYVFELAAFVVSIPDLLDMYRFYTYLLGVPDADIQTMPWPEIVRLIGDIKKHNPVTSLSNGPLAEMLDGPAAAASTPKLDAHDIANRILRQDNYLTALYSRDLLDLRVRFPLPKAVEHLAPPALVTGSGLPRTRGDQRQYLTFGGSTLTKTLELNLNFCVMGCLFDQRGQVKKEVIRERNRKDLVEHLRRRFIFMGLVNAILAPFIVVWVLIYAFFRYFDEYHKNPSSIGSRKYTRFAEWKFREFNELPHLLDRRLKQSYPVAKEYIDQFPKERTSLIVRFVAFIAGSFAAVLLVASLIDPDLFLHFEITPHRTVLFYLGVFGSILAIARGMVPEENLVFDPEYLMRELVHYTHYLPPEWKGKLHSQKVHAEFGQLFQMKIMIFAHELISVLLTPFILWFSLPDCSGAIIDFFREFTVHVEGIGYVCSFAVFDFDRPGAVGAEGAAAAAAAATTAGAPSSPAYRLRSRLPHHPPPAGTGAGPSGGKQDWYDAKMEKSVLHFKASHPDWQPADPGASVFLDRLMDAQGREVPQRSAYGRGALGLLRGDRERERDKGERERERSPAAQSRWFQPAELATMDENAEDDEAEAMGWHRRIGGDDGEGEGDDEGEGAKRGLLLDAGILLHNVMNR